MLQQHIWNISPRLIFLNLLVHVLSKRAPTAETETDTESDGE